MKSKAHQITLKEKYKAKIANLFTNWSYFSYNQSSTTSLKIILIDILLY